MTRHATIFCMLPYSALLLLPRYNDKLNQARRLGVKKGFSVGLSLAFVFFFLFGTYSVGFGFGGYLIAELGADAGDILTVFFSVVIGAFSLGQAVPNLESLLTAAGAATAVYETIDRTPPIDSSSEEGLKPEELDPTIELRNVNFTYPTRPDVQVSQNQVSNACMLLRLHVACCMALHVACCMVCVACCMMHVYVACCMLLRLHCMLYVACYHHMQG